MKIDNFDDDLAKRLGSRQAKGIIATTYDIEQEEFLQDGIYRRFKKMHIKCITPQQFENYNPKNIFKTVI